MLVGEGKGMAAEANKVPVPQRLNNFKNLDIRLFLNFLSR